MGDDVDCDGSGCLELGEFVKLMRTVLQQEARKRFDIFQMLKQRDGRVNMTSLPTAITHLMDGADPLPELLAAAMKQASRRMSANSAEDDGTLARGRSNSFSALAS